MNKYINGKFLPMTDEEEQNYLYETSCMEKKLQSIPDTATQLARGLSTATTIQAINSAAKTVLGGEK